MPMKKSIAEEILGTPSDKCCACGGVAGSSPQYVLVDNDGVRHKPPLTYCRDCANGARAGTGNQLMEGTD